MPFNWDLLNQAGQPPNDLASLAGLADIYGQTPQPSSDRIAPPPPSPQLALGPSQVGSMGPDIPPALLPAKPPNPVAAAALAALQGATPQLPGWVPTKPGAPAKSPQPAARAQKQDYAAELGDITARRETAATSLADAEAARADARAQGLAEAGKDLAGHQQAADDYRRNLNTEIDKRQSALEAEVNQLGSQQVNRNAWWDDTSALGKVAIVLGLVGGGLQQASTGKNNAVETINGMIDRSIATQSANIASKRAALNDKGNMLRTFIARGDSEYDAQVKTAALMYDSAIKQADAEAAKYDSPVIKAKLEDFKAGLQEARADKIANWRQEQAKIGISGGQLALGREQFKYEKQKDALAYLSKTPGMDKAIFAVTDGKGAFLQAPSDVVAKEINSGISDAQNLSQTVDRMIELRREAGNEVLPSAKKAELDSLHKQAMGFANRAFKFGALDAGGQEMLGGILPSQTGFKDWIRDGEPALRAFQATLNQGVTNELQTRTGYQGSWSAKPYRGGVDFQRKGGEEGMQRQAPFGLPPMPGAPPAPSPIPGIQLDELTRMMGPRGR